MLLTISFILQILATAAMTGIIWLVQIAVYPLFARLDDDRFQDYHNRYMKQVSYVIAPLMFLEASTCAVCLYLGDWRDFLLPTLFLALIWGSTAFIQVPQHQRLTPDAVPALVRSNWIRTTAWTIRLIALTLILSA